MCVGNPFLVASNFPLLPPTCAPVNHHRPKPRIPTSPLPFARSRGTLLDQKAIAYLLVGWKGSEMGWRKLLRANLDKEGRRGGRGSTSSSAAFHQEAPNTLGKLPSGFLEQTGSGPLPKGPAQAEVSSLKTLWLLKPGTYRKKQGSGAHF